MASNYSPKYFNITFPQEYVAHVEINRPNQLNAFFEAYVQNIRISISSYLSKTIQTNPY